SDFFLRPRSAASALCLAMSRLLECFTQTRDDLVLAFLSVEGEFFMRAYLGPDFSCLSFPKNFHRARKNTVGLFPPLIGLRCNGVHQHLNERSFRLVFESGVELLFRMHGTRANVLLLHDGIDRKSTRLNS